jgi:hypothetical protein
LFGDLFARLTSWQRGPRTGINGEDDRPGAAGAGDRSPLLLRTPVLVGANARRLEDVA